MTDSLWQDLRYTIRGLRREPLFTAFIVTTLALGIGANAAIFGVVDRLFLRPPAGVAEPAGLRRLYLRTNWTVGNVTEIAPGIDFVAFTALADGFGARVQVAANTKPDTIAMGEGESARTVMESYATASYLPLLGVRPALGRLFTADEDRMGAGTPVAVISHSLWRTRFSGDSGVIGRSVAIGLQRYTIVGVAARDFAGADLDATDVWVPMATIAMRPSEEGQWFAKWRWVGPQLQIVARPSVDTPDGWIASSATATYRAGMLANVQRNPDTTAVVLVGPLLQSLAPSIKPAPQLVIVERLEGMMVIVLIIACANVANLLLARAMKRRREIAVRLALGVSRRRLVTQLLTESIVLSSLAGVASTVVAFWGGTALRATLLPAVHWAGAAFDVRVLIFIGAIALMTGMAAGLAPAIRASRPDLTTSLKAGVREGGGQHSRLRNTLVVVQVALSVALVAGAGLFVRSLSGVRGIDLGYETDRIIYATVQMVNAEGHYVEPRTLARQPALTAALEGVMTRLARMPDIERTALATAGPMAGYFMTRIMFKDGTPVPVIAERDAAIIGVSPEFFATTGMRLVRGRFFRDDDKAGAVPVLVVNETAARSYWPGRDAIGQCLTLRVSPTCMTVVGVAKDSHVGDVVEQSLPQLYMAFVQAEGTAVAPSYIVVRAAAGRTMRAVEEVRQELVRAFPAGESIVAVTPLSAHLEPQLRPWRLGASLFSACGALALLVAAVGVYSVLTYTFSQREHEVGVRVALGAQAGDVIRLVLDDGLAIVAVGVVAGLALVLALGQLVGSLLYGVTARDPVTLGGAAIIMLAVGVLASVMPAWRAMRVDPTVALRQE